MIVFYFWCGVVLVLIGALICWVDDFDWRGVFAFLWGIVLIAYTLYRGLV